MNRIERISAILIQLQSKKVVKGQDIADRFKISLRTAYRDLKALEESGVPLVSEPGLGYSLMDGYRLPPIMFTKDEAIAFLTAEKLVEKLTDSSTYQIYQSALYKIKAVLKTDNKAHIDQMNQHIEVVQNPYLPYDKETSDHLQTILTCISKKLVLSLHFFALHNQENTHRKVEPVGIYLMGNQWYLIAFCLLRKDYRNFRLDRIQKSQQTENAFTKQHPPLKTYLKEITKNKEDLKTIVIRVDSSKIKHFGEQKYYNGYVSEKTLKHQTEMTFLTTSLEGFARWYMMFGDVAEIMSPNELKIRVCEIAKALIKNLK